MDEKKLLSLLYEEINQLHKKILDLENKNIELSNIIKNLTEGSIEDKMGLYEK